MRDATCHDFWRNLEIKLLAGLALDRATITSGTTAQAGCPGLPESRSSCVFLRVPQILSARCPTGSAPVRRRESVHLKKRKA